MRVADKNFWLLNSAAVGAAIFQTSAVAHCRHTVGKENCADKYGPFIAMQSVNVGYVVGMSVVSYFWNRSDIEGGRKPGSWCVLPAGPANLEGCCAGQKCIKS